MKKLTNSGPLFGFHPVSNRRPLARQVAEQNAVFALSPTAHSRGTETHSASFSSLRTLRALLERRGVFLRASLSRRHHRFPSPTRSRCTPGKALLPLPTRSIREPRHAVPRDDDLASSRAAGTDFSRADRMRMLRRRYLLRTPRASALFAAAPSPSEPRGAKSDSDERFPGRKTDRRRAGGGDGARLLRRRHWALLERRCVFRMTFMTYFARPSRPGAPDTPRARRSRRRPRHLAFHDGLRWLDATCATFSLCPP